LQSANVYNNLPDLLIGQNTLPGDHRSAILACADAPEEVIIANGLSQFGQIPGFRIKRGAGRAIAMTLRAVAGFAVGLEHTAPAEAASAPSGLVLPEYSAGTGTNIATALEFEEPPQAARVSAESANIHNKTFFIHPPVC
jgi:hypothetical protein